MITARDAYRNVVRVKKGKRLTVALDYDKEHYVFCFSKAKSDEVDQDPDWVWVSKHDGIWGAFYPFKEVKRFMKALNTKNIELEMLK